MSWLHLPLDRGCSRDVWGVEIEPACFVLAAKELDDVERLFELARALRHDAATSKWEIDVRLLSARISVVAPHVQAALEDLRRGEERSLAKLITACPTALLVFPEIVAALAEHAAHRDGQLFKVIGDELGRRKKRSPQATARQRADTAYAIREEARLRGQQLTDRAVLLELNRGDEFTASREATLANSLRSGKSAVSAVFRGMSCGEHVGRDGLLPGQGPDAPTMTVAAVERSGLTVRSILKPAD